MRQFLLGFAVGAWLVGDFFYQGMIAQAKKHSEDSARIVRYVETANLGIKKLNDEHRKRLEETKAFLAIVREKCIATP